MANVTKVFHTGLQELLEGGDIGDTIKIMLLGADYLASFSETAATVSAVTAVSAELSGTGYASGWGGAGRKTLSPAIANDATDISITDVSAAATWTGLDAGTVYGAVIYRHVTSDAVDKPLFFIDIDGGFVSNGSTFAITFPSGVANIGEGTIT